MTTPTQKDILKKAAWYLHTGSSDNLTAFQTHVEGDTIDFEGDWRDENGVRWLVEFKLKISNLYVVEEEDEYTDDPWPEEGE